MPYLIDGKHRLTDTAAIMTYLCASYEPELLGQSPAERARVDMLYSQLKDVKSGLTGPCYIGANPMQLKETAKQRMQPIVAAFGKNEFIIGEKITYLDFYFLELCDFV